MQNEASRIVAKELGSQEIVSEKMVQIMEMVADLEEVVLTKKSRMGAATIGGAVDAYDAAFDRYDIRVARTHAKEIQDLVDGETRQTTLEPTVQRAIVLAHDNLNPAALAALKDLTIAQTDSLQQRDGTADRNKILDITRRKGANFVLLFALEVNPDMSAKRRKCYEELGYLVQLIDDFNDREMDKKDGIITLVNTVSKPEGAAAVREQYGKVKELFTKAYEEYKLIKLFAYIDRLMAGSGLVG